MPPETDATKDHNMIFCGPFGVDLLSIANTHIVYVCWLLIRDPLQKGQKGGQPWSSVKTAAWQLAPYKAKIASFVLSCEKADQSGDEHQHQHSKLIIVVFNTLHQRPARDFILYKGTASWDLSEC